jgi:HEAT repeat protein
MDTLLRDLREGATEQRRRAAQALRDYGAAAVEPLCLALRDKDVNVRIAAAESLGLVGDERAVQPLMEALRGCFVKQSAYLQLAAALLFIGLIVILWIGNILTSLIFSPSVISGVVRSGLVGIVVGFAIPYYLQRRSQSKLCQAFTETLVRIAERNPTPELRNILPDLKAIAVDVLHQEESTRTTSRQAARRIEALTEQLKSLPLPAAAPAPDAATLPRTTDAPAQETERLPRVMNG